jgi:hypothetical protein
MMMYVPALKRSMEAVIYTFKGILADHKLLDAFWVGNLKNRSLDGKEVRPTSSRRCCSCTRVCSGAVCAAGAVRGTLLAWSSLLPGQLANVRPSLRRRGG